MAITFDLNGLESQHGGVGRPEYCGADALLIDADESRLQRFLQSAEE